MYALLGRFMTEWRMRELKQEKKRESGSLSERMRARYGAAAMTGKDTVVLCGQRRATVYGCRRILFYSPREIRLLVGKVALSVQGERLYCSAFTAGTVTVEGLILGVSYVAQLSEK